MRKLFFIFLFSITIISCDKNEKSVVDVSHIQVDFSIERFDQDFYTSTEKDLSRLKEKYPLFFPKQTADSIWISKIKEERDLFKETQKVFLELDFLKIELEELFKRVKFYNSKFKEPKVITLINSVDYDNRVIFTGDLLLISLDVYLGKNHEFYADYPSYIKQNFTREHIIVDVAKAIVEKSKPNNRSRTFVSKMIDEGKYLFLLDLYLPFVKDNSKIGYSLEKFKWAEANEEQVWKYFIENKLLFSTDTKLNQRFLELAPFSKFYRSEDNQSPGRIGAWVGWQIVKSYMASHDVPLQILLSKSPEEIFNESKYKPKK